MWPWGKMKMLEWTLPSVNSPAPQNRCVSVVAEPTLPLVVGVVTAPVFGHSPSLDPLLDSPGSQPSVIHPKMPCTVDELSPESDLSLVSPRSDVTFGPSVTSISPCSTKRTHLLVDRAFSSPRALPSVDSFESLVPQTSSVPPRKLSSSSVDSKPLSEVSCMCQAHLVKLHPVSVALSPSPCQGKRLRACKLVLCDLLFQNGQAVFPVQSSPVEAILCGKHRELYYARRDECKCYHQGRYGLGISISLKEGPIAECRDHLQARFLAPSPSPTDSLGQRSSSKVSDRSVDVRSGPPGAAPVSGPTSGSSAVEPIDSSSSSGLSIPELVDCIDDGNVPSEDSFTSAIPVFSQSFAQNVRAELESLSSKGAAADLSIWAKKANQAIAVKETGSSQTAPLQWYPRNGTCLRRCKVSKTPL